MTVIEFTVWDAPGFGSPRVDCVSTHWREKQLVSVSLGRSEGEEKESPPAITLVSMDVSLADASRQGLTLGPLFLYVERFAEAQGVSPAEATDLLFQLSEQAGTPTTLTVQDSSVRAHRHEILSTGDWVITTLDPDVAVCVSGGRGIAVPQLRKADMELWNGPLSEQVNDMARR